jgi:hypothetical protein
MGTMLAICQKPLTFRLGAGLSFGKVSSYKIAPSNIGDHTS